MKKEKKQSSKIPTNISTERKPTSAVGPQGKPHVADTAPAVDDDLPTATKRRSGRGEYRHRASLFCQLKQVL